MSGEHSGPSPKELGIEPQSRKIEFQGKNYDVIDKQKLLTTDLAADDRIFITTESGNRYMIRWSKSANAPKVYNERNNFQDGLVLYNQYGDGKAIAEIGQAFNFIVVTDPVNNTGQTMRSTKVTGIEIRKGIDRAIEEASGSSGMAGLAQMLKDQARGRTGQ